MPERGECLRRFDSARQSDGIEQNGRHRFERYLCFDHLSVVGLDRTERRRDVARHGTELSESLVKRGSRGGIDAVCHQDANASCTYAAVSGALEQRQ
jgi:hypothetical protein